MFGYPWNQFQRQGENVSVAGGGSTPVARYATFDEFSYCGSAVAGSLESDAVWSITRISRLNLSITTAVGVKWDDKLTAIYN